MSMRISRWGLVATLVLSAAAAAPAQDAAARADAVSMERKLVAIVSHGEAQHASPSKAAPTQRTSFTDRELNAYFNVYGPEFLPEGVANPQLAFDRGGRIRAKAIVDLDRALKPKERSWLDPLAWLSGKVDVMGEGTLKATNGTGVFELETATIAGLTVPKAFLQEVVSYYFRSADNPKGFQFDQPFELPSAIRSVETSAGRAIVVQ